MGIKDTFHAMIGERGSSRVAASLWNQSFPWLLMALVIALGVIQSPAERLVRYLGYDSGVDLTMQNLMARGYRPTVDFAIAYGLLPLLINKAWYAIAGLTPSAFRVEVLLVTCVTAWGMARFASARQVGPAGAVLIVLAIPDVLFPSYSTVVHVLEPALLVHGLAEQARGRHGTALALATAALFVKPSMAYVYGFCLLVSIVAASRGGGRPYWVRLLGPATAGGGVLALVLTAVYGFGPLVASLLPTKGAAIYRIGGYGFFRGTGREFWALPETGFWGCFRYEVGFWVLGSLWLAWGGLEAVVRLARGRSIGDEIRDNEIVACCAALHVVFVTCFFGQRMSWTYYFAILVLGLAVRAKGPGKHVIVAWCLAVLLLINDRSKLLTTYREWSTSAPSRETLGLWASPGEQVEWRKVLELTRDTPPVLLARVEGSVILIPRFAPPVAAYLCPGLTLSVEIHRKVSQLSSAELIVSLVGRDWEGFTFWPELAAAFDGCEFLFDGKTFLVYRRTRPPSR